MWFDVFSYWCPNLLLRNWSGTRPSLVTGLQTNPQWFLKVINLDPFRNCVFTHSDFNRLFMIGKKSFHFFQRCKVCYLKKRYRLKILCCQCDHTSHHLSAVEYTLNKWNIILQGSGRVAFRSQTEDVTAGVWVLHLTKIVVEWVLNSFSGQSLPSHLTRALDWAALV